MDIFENDENDLLNLYKDVIEGPEILLSWKCPSGTAHMGCNVNGVNGAGCCTSQSNCVWCTKNGSPP